jgi:hypothetical protein
VTGTDPDGAAYAGTQTITDAGGGVYSLTWDLGDFGPYEGVGIMAGDNLVISTRPTGDDANTATDPCGVEVITWNDDGTISATWAEQGDTATSSETVEAWSAE